MIPDGIRFRPIGPDDEPFLSQVYASTRQEEMTLLDWTEEQKTAFLQQQFTAQHQFYQTRFPDAAFQIILLHDQPIGRLYVDRQPDVLLLIDIAVLPAHRNAGIGTAILRELLAEADRTGQSVLCHVERWNRALSLYQRLGFAVVAEDGVYYELIRPSGRSRREEHAGEKDPEVPGEC